MSHAIAAAELKPYSNTSKEVNENFGTGASESKPIGISGTYYAYAEAYKLAAERVGLLPREMQSITWEAVRIMFSDSFKRNKELTSKIDSIWEENISRADGPITDRASIFEDIHSEILNFVAENDKDTESPRGENLRHPDWYRPSDSTADNGTGATPDQGGVAEGTLPAGGGPGRGAPGDANAGPGGVARLKVRNTAQRFADMLAQGTAPEMALVLPFSLIPRRILSHKV